MTTTQHTERLSRAEADIVVRQLAGEFHNRHSVENRDSEDSLFRDFARKLAWQIGGDDSRDFRDYLVDVLTAFENLMDIYWGSQPHDRRDRYESDLNTAVNGALGAAGIEAGYINRYGDDVAPGLQRTPAGGLIDRARFDALAKRIAA